MHGQFDRVRGYVEDYGIFVAVFCIGGLALFFWSKLRAEETPSSFAMDEASGDCLFEE